jgi:hypothetical protein
MKADIMSFNVRSSHKYTEIITISDDEDDELSSTAAMIIPRGLPTVASSRRATSSRFVDLTLTSAPSQRPHRLDEALDTSPHSNAHNAIRQTAHSTPQLHPNSTAATSPANRGELSRLSQDPVAVESDRRHLKRRRLSPIKSLSNASNPKALKSPTVGRKVDPKQRSIYDMFAKVPDSTIPTESHLQGRAGNTKRNHRTDLGDEATYEVDLLIDGVIARAKDKLNTEGGTMLEKKLRSWVLDARRAGVDVVDYIEAAIEEDIGSYGRHSKGIGPTETDLSLIGPGASAIEAYHRVELGNKALHRQLQKLLGSPRGPLNATATPSISTNPPQRSRHLSVVIERPPRFRDQEYVEIPSSSESNGPQYGRRKGAKKNKRGPGHIGNPGRKLSNFQQVFIILPPNPIPPLPTLIATMQYLCHPFLCCENIYALLSNQTWVDRVS